MADLGKYSEKFDELGISRETAKRYVELFNGKIFIVKGGGDVVTGKGTLAYDLVAMHDLGIIPIIVHGGKKRIDQKLGELDMKSEFVGGYRITRPEMMEPIEGALDKVNYALCHSIEHFGVRAISLKGVTYAVKHEDVDGKDLGLVGEPTHLSMKKEDLISMAENGILVVSPISIADDERGAILNTNADDVAGFAASEICAEKLLYLTNMDGVIIDGLTVLELGIVEAEKYIEIGEIDRGMVPKVRCAIKAKRGGVGAVHIINGETEHALFREIYSDAGIGTMIV